MREASRNFMVGLVSIVAIIGFSALLLSFGELDSLFHPRYQLTIRTDNSVGLRPGGALEFNGVPVGVIDSVTIVADPTYPVQLIVLVNMNARIPMDVIPFAATPLIGGSSRLQLQSPKIPSATSAEFLPIDGTAEIVGPIHGGLLDEVTAELDARMKPVIEALESFNRLSETYISLGENLNAQLLPQDDSALKDGEQPNLRTAVVKLNTVLDEARSGLELANEWLGDDSLRGDFSHAVERANALIDEATEAIQRYVRLADSLEANTDEMTKSLLPVADQLGTTLEEIRRVARLANDGDGTVAQLLKNPDLYNSLNDAAIRLEETLVRLQLLIEKLQAEGVRLGI